MDSSVLKFTCPACKTPLTVPRSLAGVQGPCPKCGVEITAPQAEVGQKAFMGSDAGALSQPASPASPTANPSTAPSPPPAFPQPGHSPGAASGPPSQVPPFPPPSHPGAAPVHSPSSRLPSGFVPPVPGGPGMPGNGRPSAPSTVFPSAADVSGAHVRNGNGAASAVMPPPPVPAAPNPLAGLAGGNADANGQPARPREDNQSDAKRKHHHKRHRLGKPRRRVPQVALLLLALVFMSIGGLLFYGMRRPDSSVGKLLTDLRQKIPGLAPAAGAPSTPAESGSPVNNDILLSSGTSVPEDAVGVSGHPIEPEIEHPVPLSGAPSTPAGDGGFEIRRAEVLPVEPVEPETPMPGKNGSAVEVKAPPPEVSGTPAAPVTTAGVPELPELPMPGNEGQPPEPTDGASEPPVAAPVAKPVAPVPPAGSEPEIPRPTVVGATPEAVAKPETVAKPEAVAPADASKPQSALEGFLAAPDWKSRLAFIQDAPRLRPLVEEYYRSRPDGPIKIDSIDLFHSQEVGVTGYAFYIFSVVLADDSTASGPSTFTVVVNQTDEGFRVNWEAFIQFKDNHFSKFLASPGGVPKRFYLVLNRRHPFDGNIPDIDKKVCVRLRPLIASHKGAFAYTGLESKPGKDLLDEVGMRSWRGTYYLVVELSWTKGTDGSPYLTVDRVSEYNWTINTQGTALDLALSRKAAS